jgi:hypothetical protein
MKEVKKSNPFSLKIIVGGAIALLILAFVGSFGFSFVKSKLMNKLSGNFAALQKFTGGQLGNLPSGSTVKTKAEGIAVCQKSGVDYCWPLVAVSFNDLSVCNQALDKKACETEAKDLLQANEGSKSVTPDTSAGDSSADSTGNSVDSSLVECKKGAISQTSEGMLVVTGKENITFGGKTGPACCYETTIKVEGAADEITKTCMYIDGSDSTAVYKMIGGNYVILGGVVKDGDTQCNYLYTEEGKLDSKTCY